MAEFIKTVEASKILHDAMLTVEVESVPVTTANVDGKYFGIGAI